jgi:hypothetical protein
VAKRDDAALHDPHADRKRPRFGEEMLAPVAAELPTVDAPTRKLIRDAKIKLD